MDKITINSLFVRLEKICCKLQDIFLTLSNQNTPNKNDWEVVCLSNDGGVTIVTGIAVFDVLNGTPTTKYYIDNIEVTGYTIVSCETSGKDREILSVCVDGKTWTKIIVFEDGLPITFLWLDDTDTPTSSPDPLLINNANCLPIQNIGIEQYSGLGNVIQNSTFNANEITITYDAPIFTSTPITATLIASNLQGSGEFKIQPNTQETRKFKFPNITGVILSNVSGNNVTVEFQLN